MRHRHQRKSSLFVLLSVCFFVLTTLTAAANAMAVKRVGILPIATEQSINSETDKSLLYTKQMINYITSQLADSNIEMLNMSAYKIDKSVLDQMMLTAGEDPAKVANQICDRYGLDAAVLVKLELEAKEDMPGVWKVKAKAYIDGYDNEQKSLGITNTENLRITKNDLDVAEQETKKQLGYKIAGILSTTFHDLDKKEKNTQSDEPRSITLRLEGATNETLIDIFDKVLNTVTDIESSQILNQQIVPKKPHECYATWHVYRALDSDIFQMKVNIYKVVNDILDAGGNIDINDVAYRYTPLQVKMLQGFRSAKLTPEFIVFVIDSGQAKAKDLSERHNRGNTIRKGGSKFE